MTLSTTEITNTVTVTENPDSITIVADNFTQTGGGGGGGNVATDAIWDAAGDLAVGSGSNTAVRLAKGTALQVLRVNAGGTTLEWAAPATGTVTSVGGSFTGGIISVSGSPITSSGTLAFSVAGTSGGIPYFSSSSGWASSGALAANSLVIGGGAGFAPSTTATGTGVLTALGVNVGSSGAVVVNGGAGGTPSSITLTNATGLPVATGIAGLGSGVATWLGTASSANLAAAMTDETGNGALVFANSPTLVTPNLGAATATSINGLTITTSTGTLTITNGKTLSAGNTLTFTGTDATSHAFPSTSSSLARTDAAQTFAGTQTFGIINATRLGFVGEPDAYISTSDPNEITIVTDNADRITVSTTSITHRLPSYFMSAAPVRMYATGDTNYVQFSNAATGARTLTLPDSTDTLVGRATTDTLTNKTISGASNTITNVSLATGVTGTLPVANGGTGATSLTANNVLLGNGTSAVQVVAPGASGNVLTSNGTTWQSTAPSGGGSGDTYLVVASDTANSTTSFADVTGLTFAVTSGETYVFEAWVVYETAATTTGSKWAVNGPASPTILSYSVETPTAATTSRLDFASTYDGTSVSSATAGIGQCLAKIEGVVKVSASGTFALRFGSEVGSSAVTAKAGSFMRYRKIAP